jgi:hypothetical protein
MLAHEPVIEQRKVVKLEPHRQLEKTRDGCTAAVAAFAATVPHLASMAVDDLVVCNLITIANGPSGHDVPDPADRLDGRVRVATRIYVPLWHFHQNHPATREIVAVSLELERLGPQGVAFVNLARVVDAEDRLTGRKVARCEDAEAMDRGRSDNDIGHGGTPSHKTAR